MSWHRERVQWNREGRCARKACQAPITKRAWYNSGSDLRYCTHCARLINESAVQSGMKPLCTEVKPIPDLTPSEMPDDFDPPLL